MTRTPPPPVAQRLREMRKRTIQSWIGASDGAAGFFRYVVWKKIIGMPPPPVPPRLREMLKDYPELIDEVQGGLNRIVDDMLRHGTSTPPFERAVWRLKDTTEDFYIQARKELEAVQSHGDSKAIEQAEKKLLSMGGIGGARPWHDRSEEGLWNYFQTHKAAFE